VSIHASNVLK
jgi:hypothetical protein